MIRSFIALDLPEAVKDEINRLSSILKKTGADVKWVRPESCHLTLKFLGNVPEATIIPLTEAIELVAGGHRPLTLTLDHLGFFPPKGPPRVMWLGLIGDLEPIKNLAAEIEATVAPLGFPPETRPFSPHLTLGRVRSSRGKAELQAKAQGLQPIPLTFTSKEVVLYKSDLRPTGAIYTALSRLALAGPGQ